MGNYHKSDFKLNRRFIYAILLSLAYGNTIAVINTEDMNISNRFVVPQPFYNRASIYVVGAGSIEGALLDAKSLNIGIDKNGAIIPTNFQTQGFIGGVPEINVYKNSSFTNSHVVSAVGIGFSISKNAIANFNKPVVGTGVLNNNGELNIGAEGNLVGFALNNNGIINIVNKFVIPDRVLKIGRLHLVGNAAQIDGALQNASLYVGESSQGSIDPCHLTLASDANNLESLNIAKNSSVTIPARYNLNPSYDIKGRGKVFNHGILNITPAYKFSPGLALENTGSLNVSTAFVLPEVFVNRGAIYLSSSGSLSGNLNGGESLHIGKDIQGNVIPAYVDGNLSINNVPIINIHAGKLVANETIENCGEVHNYDQLYIKNVFKAQKITNHSGATLGLQSINIDAAIENHVGATVMVPQSSKTTAFIHNAGWFQVDHWLDAKNIENTGVLQLNNGIVADNIENVGTIKAKSGLTAQALNNFGDIDSNANIAVKNLNNHGNIISAGFIGDSLNNDGSYNCNGNIIASTIANKKTLSISGDVTAKNFESYGTLNVFGVSNFNVENFNNKGSLNLTIRNVGSFDGINSTGAVDIENSIINIYSNFIGEPNTHYHWDLITASELNYNDNATINFPQSGLHYTWHSDVHNNALRLTYSRANLTQKVHQGLSLDIATALEQIAVENQDDQCAALLHAVSGCDCHDDYELNLIKLKPNANANANFVALHNVTFKKVETRISALQDTSSELRGIATGDLGPSMASWGAAFGSFANQGAITGNLGYHAAAYGLIFGLDKQVPSDDIYGVALAISRSNIDEAASTNSKTNMSGYHFLVYGTNFFYGDNFFEWLLTGIINQNKSEREVILSGINLNVGSTYHNYQGGIRINLGKNMDFDNWGLAQVNTLQYSILHQPSYNENGSPAALHIANYDSNIVTLGSGLRVFCRPDFHSALVAKPAIHAMLTYDAVSSSQGINANFLIGGSDFTIYQNPSRLAVKLGADVGCEINDRLQLQFSYDLELRSRYNDNSFELKLKYLF